MDWFTVLLGAIIGLILLSIDAEKKRERRRKPIPAPVTSTAWQGVNFTPQFHPPRLIQTQPQANLPIAEQRVSGKALLNTWRTSVVGLIRLAQKNIACSRRHLEAGNYRIAIDAAVTSIENISRALLHCYGEKPETDSGQEEALKLLTRKFTENERKAFQKTIEEIRQLYANNIVQRYLATRNIESSFLLTRTKIAWMIESASNVVATFRRIIEEHFAAELPELGECCPKCRSLEVSVLAFNEITAYYTCPQCGHSWMLPRETQPSMR